MECKSPAATRSSDTLLQRATSRAKPSSLEPPSMDGKSLLQRATRRYFEKAYQPKYILARGSLATVWLCTRTEDGRQFACKVVHKAKVSPGDLAAVRSEVEIHAMLSKGRRQGTARLEDSWHPGTARLEDSRHPGNARLEDSWHGGIARLEEVLETEDALNLVVELCKGGNLAALLQRQGRLPEELARELFRQLASTVRFCHEQGIILGEISPEKILLQDPGVPLFKQPPGEAVAGDDVAATSSRVSQAVSHIVAHAGQQEASERGSAVNAGQRWSEVTVKVADFGQAVRSGQGGLARVGMVGMVGSEAFAATELLTGSGGCSCAVDTWSLGVLLYRMLLGRMPFADVARTDGGDAVLDGDLSFKDDDWKGTSRQAKHLLLRLLERDPASRLTSAEVMQHPWLTEGNVQSEGLTMRPSALCQPGLIGADSMARTLSCRTGDPPDLDKSNDHHCHSASLHDAGWWLRAPCNNQAPGVPAGAEWASTSWGSQSTWSTQGALWSAATSEGMVSQENLPGRSSSHKLAEAGERKVDAQRRWKSLQSFSAVVVAVKRMASRKR